MAAFGTLTLLIALVVAMYGAVASIVGARRRNRRLIDSGRTAVYALAAVLGVASVALVYAFVSNDFSIRYVQRSSDVSTPLFYKITAYWGGLDGSILWWAFLLSVFSAVAVHINRHRHREIMPYTVATLLTITGFFLYLIVFHKNPFDTFLVSAPATGKGLNPLLQNAYMATHPPSLYIGLVGMSIPYAFAMGALISGHLDDAWIAAVRRWTLIAWFFLSMGLTLGMLWAYEELGWGGFWGWDPVENAGFLPWLTGTAFLHSVMIQERRGMMKIWNFTLVILTFLLTIIGTTMTRTGIVNSVHAFGQDNVLLLNFSIFMLAIVAVSFGFMALRLPELRARGKLESWLSREAAFLLNNWILLFAAIVILMGTMWPTISEKFFGERVNVGIPFFNKWMVPIGLMLLFLSGVGPLIAWRRATFSHLRYQFTWPVTATVVTVIGTVALGLGTAPVSILCFGLCAFVTGTIVQEFVRGASIRKRNTGSDAVTALLAMVLRGRRRYGGYVVHLGVVLVFLGFAGQGYFKEEEAGLTPGDTREFAGYTLRFDGLSHEEDRQKEMVSANVTVMKDGKVIDRMRPARWYFHRSPQEPTTEVAIRRAPAEDLYLTLGNYDLAEGTVALKLVVNPLVNWIWLGFVMLALGTGIALLPETVLAPLAARAPAASTVGTGVTMLLVLLTALMGAAGPASAAGSMVGAGQVPKERLGDRSWLLSNMMCMCGGCRASLGDCPMTPCHGDEMVIEIDSMLNAGKSRDEILAAFKVRYGGDHFLLFPPDKGWNKLAWALPYAIGIAGAGGLAFGAWRYAKRMQPEPPTPAEQDPDLEERLEDELSKID